jgi:hypothetical protein
VNDAKPKHQRRQIRSTKLEIRNKFKAPIRKPQNGKPGKRKTKTGAKKTRKRIATDHADSHGRENVRREGLARS